MPTFSITVSNAAVTKLQAVVARYNSSYGTSLTVRDWIIQILKEQAIQEELVANAITITAQRQETEAAAVQTAIEAERQRLLGTV